MTLLDRNNEELEVVSQHLVPHRLETVYNIEVDGFHTYHVGELGTWVHNANCCNINVSGTIHGGERFAERGFTKTRIEEMVNDYTEKGYQPGGATVYIKKKNDGSYDVIVINKDNELITAVGGNESRQKLPNRAAVMKMLKNHGGFSGIPVD